MSLARHAPGFFLPAAGFGLARKEGGAEGRRLLESAGRSPGRPGDAMKRMIFAAAMAATVFGLYRCANVAPEHSKYRPLFAAALAKQLETFNPLCAEPFGVPAFPFQAAADWRGWSTRPPAGSTPDQSPRPPPDNPLVFKWRDLVAAGVVYESEHLDLDLNFDGYVYELSPKGRGLYSQVTRKDGRPQARLCLGKPVLKEVLAIGKPAYTVAGLEVPVRYVLKVDNPSPLLYDGTAKALGLTVPTRSPSGEVLYPETVAVMTLARGTDDVISLEQR